MSINHALVAVHLRAKGIGGVGVIYWGGSGRGHIVGHTSVTSIYPRFIGALMSVSDMHRAVLYGFNADFDLAPEMFEHRHKSAKNSSYKAQSFGLC